MVKNVERFGTKNMSFRLCSSLFLEHLSRQFETLFFVSPSLDVICTSKLSYRRGAREFTIILYLEKREADSGPLISRRNYRASCSRPLC